VIGLTGGRKSPFDIAYRCELTDPLDPFDLITGASSDGLHESPLARRKSHLGDEALIGKKHSLLRRVDADIRPETLMEIRVSCHQDRFLIFREVLSDCRHSVITLIPTEAKDILEPDAREISPPEL
jgi:hypothetical protein